MKGKKKKQKRARIVGVNYTEEAGLKHTYTLVTVDSDCVSNLLYTPTKKKAARAESSFLHLSPAIAVTPDIYSVAVW